MQNTHAKAQEHVHTGDKTKQTQRKCKKGLAPNIKKETVLEKKEINLFNNRSQKGRSWNK
jgi:hypothetical protein